MITMITPLSAGNAVGLYLAPPSNADQVRILRNDLGVFTGYDDEDSNLIYEGDRIPYVLDINCINGETYHYGVFYRIAGVWIANNVEQITPSATFTDESVDVQSLLRQRLDDGLAVYVSNGIITHAQNHIPVLIASPLIEETIFPIVSVHLTSLVPDVRGVGEGLMTSAYESYLSRWQLEIIGWSKNSDERKALRNAIHAVLMANFPVFDNVGLVEINLSFGDVDDFQTYDAPVFMTRCAFSCVAPSAVSTQSSNPIVSTFTVNPQVII